MHEAEAIVHLANDAAEEGADVVLCTVVRLIGSGYGRPGAKLLLTDEGHRAGFVSGGCLERELARLAWPATTDGPAVLTFDTRGTPLHPGGRYNAGCDGCLHILCERGHDSAGLAAVRSSLADALTTAVVFDSGTTDLPVGTRQAAGDAGSLAGCFEDAGDTACTIELDGGLLAFRETQRPPSELLLFGAGDDAVSLAAIATHVGRRVTVLDASPERLTAARFPSVRRVVGTTDEQLAAIEPRSSTAAVLMTHSFPADLVLLPALLASRCGYVGLLGPKRRLARLMEALRHEGRFPSPASCERLHAPIGLDLGAVTPGEIAIAILAEIIADQRCRDGAPLARRPGPIHDATPHRKVAT